MIFTQYFFNFLCHRCPVYYNLPSECTLVKSDTQCCLQPVCDFKPQISTTETTSPGKTPDGVGKHGNLSFKDNFLLFCSKLFL